MCFLFAETYLYFKTIIILDKIPFYFQYFFLIFYASFFFHPCVLLKHASVALSIYPLFCLCPIWIKHPTVSILRSQPPVRFLQKHLILEMHGCSAAFQSFAAMRQHVGHSISLLVEVLVEDSPVQESEREDLDEGVIVERKI